MRMGLCCTSRRIIVSPRIAALLCAAAFVFVFCRLQPQLEMRAAEFAQMAANRAVNSAVSKVFAGVDYYELSSVRENSDGEITAVTMNTGRMNQLRAEVASAVLADTENFKDGCIRIPLGAVLGVDLLAAVGPRITVKTVSLGQVNVDFYDEFEDAGINQVKHKIYLTASVTISVIGAAASEGETVTAEIPVAETLIVGKVPSYYAQGAGMNVVSNNAPDGQQNGDVNGRTN